MPALVMMVWLGGLATVIGFAIVGQDPTRDHVVSASPATSDAAPRPQISVPETRAFVVRGRVARDIDQVWLGLMTGGGATVATAPLDPTGHGHGGWIPFESRLEVDRADVDAGTTLYVLTVDPAGSPVGVVRRPISGSLFLVVGRDGIAATNGGFPSSSTLGRRGFPSSSPISVFGLARPPT